MRHVAPPLAGYQLRENGLWLSDNTVGDVSTSRHGFAPKAPNDTTKFLRGDGAWGTISGIAFTFGGCRVTRASNKSISHNSETVVDFDTEFFDTNAYHDNATNNTRLTVPSGLAGYYSITACGVFAANGTGTRNVALRVNGATYICSQHSPGNASSGTGMSPSTNYYMSVGDYVEMTVYQNSGGNLNLNATGDFTPVISMVLLGV